MSDKKVEDLTLLTLLPVDKLLAALDVESATLWGLHHAPLQVVYGSVHAWNRRPSNRVHHLHLGINLLAVLIARDEFCMVTYASGHGIWVWVQNALVSTYSLYPIISLKTVIIQIEIETVEHFAVQLYRVNFVQVH